MTDPYRAVLGENLIQFPPGEADFDHAKQNEKPEEKEDRELTKIRVEKLINSIATILLINPPEKIFLYGHTDTLGKPDQNMPLSQKRAEFVKKHFVEAGLDEISIKPVPCGQDYPQDRKLSNEAHRKNRRVVLELRYVASNDKPKCGVD